MGLVIQSPSARNDLIDIWVYIAQNNETAANKLINTIEEKLHLLSNTPEMGQPREELSPSLRSFTVGKYILFYCPIPGGI